MNRAACLLALLCAFNGARADGYFPSSYETSRARFRENCQKWADQGGQCGFKKIESQKDQDLTVDFGYFGKGGTRLLVIESGIHGPEAPAGAAVLQLVFEKYLDQLLKHNVDVLMVHALNPYGFKHWRRTDENNVNLNRNFPAGNSIYESKNLAYARLRYMFEPQNKVGNIALDSFMTSAKFLWAYLASKLNKRYINEAMNSGQYEFSQGLNYGGHENSAQVKFLRELLPPMIEKHTGPVLFLDFHTGLGENGVLQIINGLHPPKNLLALWTKNWGSLGPSGIKMVNANDETNADFYTDQGDVIDFVPMLSSHPEQVLALTMEYGTMGTDTLNQLRTADRMVLENQAHFFGCGSEETCHSVQMNFRDLFDPPDQVWRKMVIDEAGRIFSVVAEKL